MSDWIAILATLPSADPPSEVFDVGDACASEWSERAADPAEIDRRMIAKQALRFARWQGVTPPRRITDRQWRAVQMRFGEDATYGEIASDLGMDFPESARVQVLKATRRIAERLRGRRLWHTADPL